MAGTPIEITLYNQDNEVIQSYTRTIIPWKILKKAVRLSKNLNIDEISEESIDELSALIVEVFGDKFSIEDLEEGADISDMINVLMAIVNKARGMVNPTLPGPGRRQRPK